MSERKEALRQTIVRDHEASMALLRALTPEQWQQSVPSEEEAPWVARDVLAHLAISERGQLYQINRTLAGEPTVPPDFDLNRYNRGAVRKQAEATVEALLQEIEAAHGEVLAALDGVAEADLDKTGRHARGDTLTVEQFFHRVTEHRLAHAEELTAGVGG